jgi:hypothetical protein
MSSLGSFNIIIFSMLSLLHCRSNQTLHDKNKTELKVVRIYTVSDQHPAECVINNFSKNTYKHIIRIWEHTNSFVVSVFVLAPNWKQSEYPSAG